MALHFLAVLGTALLSIWNGVKYVSDKALDLAKEILTSLRQGFNWFLVTAPKPVRILVFFFIVLVFADTVISFFVGMGFACNTSGQLLKPETFGSGVVLYFERMFEDFENSSTDYDTFLEEKTVIAETYGRQDARRMLYVKCFGTNPKLTVFGLDFLNYQYWVLLLLIGLVYRVGKNHNLF